MSFYESNKVYQGTSESENIEACCSNSTIYGNGGNDTIVAGPSYYYPSNNVFFGGDGNDHLETYGTSKVYGGSGKDTLNINSGVFADGGDGDDSIIIKSSDVMLYGGKGEDIFTIQGNIKSTIMDMTSNDSLYIDNSSKKFTYKIEDGSMIFSDTDNTFEITFDDVSKASKLANVKVKYFMGTKTSTLGKLLGLPSSGGDGLPTGLTYNSDKTKITASKKFTGSSINLTKYPKVKTLDASAVTKKLKITGNSLDNSIQGGSKNDTIFGGAGNDTLIGGAGNDVLTGGKGKDVFVYTKGNDTIKDYTAGDDVINLQDATIKSWKISGKNVIFTTTNGKITVKNGKGKAITITETKTYNSSSSALFAENNFVTADNLSEIVKNDLTATDYKIDTQNFENLSQKNNLIAFTDK